MSDSIDGESPPRTPNKKKRGLTDLDVRKARARDRGYKLTDEKSMFLFVSPTGGKLWRLKYRVNGKEKLLSLGRYPDVSLSSARDRRDEMRKLIAAGIDPSEQRRANRQEIRESTESTFENKAREWFKKFSANWGVTHRRNVLDRLENYVFPYLGSKVTRQITAQDVLSVLRRIEAKGAIETAHRVRGIIGQIFRYAVSSGSAERNPSADLRGAITPAKVEHRAAITEPRKVSGLLRVLDDYKGSIIVRCALQLAPLVFVRPGELRKAEWSELDLDAGQWSIPAEKMKMRQPFLVPLSKQAVSILREIQPITGSGRYVFPSARSSNRPMSDNAILAAFRRSGIAKEEMSGHGFRAMARTIMAEVLNVRAELLELQLAHSVKDSLGRAYNRTQFLPERVAMMQQWADYLDKLKATGGEE